MPRSSRRRKKGWSSTPQSLRANQAIRAAAGDMEAHDEPSYSLPNDPVVRAIAASPEYRMALSRVGDKLKRIAESNAPEDTSDLKKSISSGLTEEGSIIVSVDVPYGVFVDQGTARTPAQPFLSSLLDEEV